MDANWGLGLTSGGFYPHESTIANRCPKKAPPAFDLSQPGSEAPGADPSLRPENDAAVVHRPQRTLADWHGPCTSTIVPDRGITPGRFPAAHWQLTTHVQRPLNARGGRQTLPGVFLRPAAPTSGNTRPLTSPLTGFGVGMVALVTVPKPQSARRHGLGSRPGRCRKYRRAAYHDLLTPSRQIVSLSLAVPAAAPAVTARTASQVEEKIDGTGPRPGSSRYKASAEGTTWRRVTRTE